MNWVPLSEWTDEGQPKIQNSLRKQCITVLADMSEHGKTKGNPEYLSTITRRYLFLVQENFGPEKSIETRSNGFKALMRLPVGGLWNLGFSSEQMEQCEQTFFTSSKENGKFFILTKWYNLVTPG